MQSAQLIEQDAPAIKLQSPGPQFPVAPQQEHQVPALQMSADPTVQLLQTAVQRGASMEEIRELLQLRRELREDQERERQREAVLAFRRDFAAFRGENIIVPKTKHVDRGRGGSFDQAEYDRVVGMLSPALSKHGFGFRHDQKFGTRKWSENGVESDIGWVWVTCYLEHRDGHVETLQLEGPPGDLTVNTPTQNMQATASYLKRQSLLAITGTPTGGEDDESRLRGRQPDPGDQAGDDGLTEAERLQMDGDTAADEGMDALTKWWGSLSNKQRTLMNPHFGGMRKRAQRAGGKAA
jgi:hypothetical protein